MFGEKLYRIEAIVDIETRGIKKGDKGGFVSDKAKVYGNAWIYGDAEVYGKIICETGYYFAFKKQRWEVEEIKLGDGNIVLFRK